MYRHSVVADSFPLAVGGIFRQHGQLLFCLRFLPGKRLLAVCEPCDDGHQANEDHVSGLKA